MSAKKRADVYDAIHRQIISLRIYASRRDTMGEPYSVEEMDERLFRLEMDIWNGVKNALQIDEVES